MTADTLWNAAGFEPGKKDCEVVVLTLLSFSSLRHAAFRLCVSP